MTLELNFLTIFLFGVTLQGLFLFIVLLLKGHRLSQKSYLLLAILIALFTFYLFKAGISSSGLISQFPHLVVTGFLVLPAVAPLCYQYLCSLLNIQLSVKSKALHWSFFIIQTIYWAPFFMSSVSWKFGVLREEIESQAYSNNVGLGFELVLILQHFIYIFLLRNLVNKRMGESSSVNIQWVRKIVFFFTIYAMAFAVGTLSFRFMDQGMPDYIFYTVIATFIYLIGYYGYAQRDFLHELKTGDKPRYLFTNMSSQESKMLYESIMELITGKNLYLIKGLRIGDLARELEEPVNHVSRAINENHLGSFNDLVNSFRIKKAKELLSDEKNKDKLFAIALNSGFSNKVSFYKNFKNLVGQSPSTFRDRMRKNSQIHTAPKEK